MVRLYLFAEGQTEQTFADELLKSHLASYGVYMNNARLIASGKKKGKVYRGGGSSYEAMKRDIVTSLKEDSNPDVIFTTMIDLYGLHNNFPGLEESKKLVQNPSERVEFLEQCFRDDISDDRFVPYLQLHEYEAYLFTDPARFEYFYPGRRKEIEALQAIAEQYQNPELINNGESSAPSKRIMAQFPEYGKAKPTVGPQLAEQIGLQAIRSRCSHFNSWLSQLESLG